MLRTAWWCKSQLAARHSLHPWRRKLHCKTGHADQASALLLCVVFERIRIVSVLVGLPAPPSNFIICLRVIKLLGDLPIIDIKLIVW